MAAAEENKNFNLMELPLLTADKDRCIEWCKQPNLITAARFVQKLLVDIVRGGEGVLVRLLRLTSPSLAGGSTIEVEWRKVNGCLGEYAGKARNVSLCRLIPATKEPIIQDHILPGTCVMSDLWRAHDCLNDEGFQHFTVNRSLNFVDPDTGAHTQNIENTWWVAKRSLPQTGRSRDMFENYLLEFLWRRHYRTHDGFPFFVFLEHIAEIYRVNN